MLTGWRIIGSVATARTENPSGSLNFLTASSGVRASAAGANDAQASSAQEESSVRIGGTPCGRLEMQNAGAHGEMQGANRPRYDRSAGTADDGPVRRPTGTRGSPRARSGTTPAGPR